jgi:hypothetical protein
MITPKGMVADHWTNRAPIGAPPSFAVTGYHPAPAKKRGKPEPEEAHCTGRGIVAVSLAAPRSKRAKPEQGSLL